MVHCGIDMDKCGGHTRFFLNTGNKNDLTNAQEQSQILACVKPCMQQRCRAAVSTCVCAILLFIDFIQMLSVGLCDVTFNCTQNVSEKQHLQDFCYVKQEMSHVSELYFLNLCILLMNCKS